MKKCICLYFLIALLVNTAADAGNLYRGSSRSHETIFARGFESRGDNFDLIKHVAVDDNDSGYVSMSKNENVAKDFGDTAATRFEQARLERQGIPVTSDMEFNNYVYEIRPQGYYIDVNKTFANLENRVGLNEAQIGKINYIKREYSGEQEVVSNFVNPNNIKSVKIYDQNKTLIRTVNNPRYSGNGVDSESLAGATIQDEDIIVTSTIDLYDEGSVASSNDSDLYVCAPE